MKIGILQTGHAPAALLQERGDYDALFQRLLAGRGFSFITYNVVDMIFPSGAHDCEGWLITGSKHGAYEDHPFIAPLEALIREIHDAALPLVGICFGHQIIAQALGGRVEKFSGGWAVGRTEYDWAGEAVAMNAWHQDQVVSPPAGAEVLASNAFCQNAALLYAGRALTLQAHPEFDADFVAGLARDRGPGVVPDDQLAEVQDNLHKPLANAAMAEKISRFFKERVLA